MIYSDRIYSLISLPIDLDLDKTKTQSCANHFGVESSTYKDGVTMSFASSEWRANETESLFCSKRDQYSLHHTDPKYSCNDVIRKTFTCTCTVA